MLECHRVERVLLPVNLAVDFNFLPVQSFGFGVLSHALIEHGEGTDRERCLRIVLPADLFLDFQCFSQERLRLGEFGFLRVKHGERH